MKKEEIIRRLKNMYELNEKRLRKIQEDTRFLNDTFKAGYLEGVLEGINEEILRILEDN